MKKLRQCHPMYNVSFRPRCIVVTYTYGTTGVLRVGLLAVMGGNPWPARRTRSWLCFGTRLLLTTAGYHRRRILNLKRRRSLIYLFTNVNRSISQYRPVIFSDTWRGVAAWPSSNDVGRINEVTLRRARLVPGWVTVIGRANHLDV